MKHYIIPVFIPHLGCLHECVFCNQRKITGQQTSVTADQVASIIDERLCAINQNRWIEVAFYGGSFTALPQTVQNDLLAPAAKALRAKRIHAIRISTRPDCISEEIMNNLADLGVSTVELGVQSLDNKVLRRAGRGHDSQAVVNAVGIIKQTGVQCGLQLMPGLPGEEWESLLGTVQQTIRLRPDFVRIYPVVVIADTALAEAYKAGTYQPLTLQQAVARAAYMKLVFERQGIPVIRTGLQASEELDNKLTVISGPYHPAFGELVDSYIFFLLLAGFIEQNVPFAQRLTIYHHPQDCSKVRGQHNANIIVLKDSYSIQDIHLTANPALKRGSLLLDYQGKIVLLNKNMINSI